MQCEVRSADTRAYKRRNGDVERGRMAARKSETASDGQAVHAPLDKYVPEELRALDDPQKDLPRIAKSSELIRLIRAQSPRLPPRTRWFAASAQHGAVAARKRASRPHVAAVLDAQGIPRTPWAIGACGELPAFFGRASTRCGAGVSRPWFLAGAWFAWWETSACRGERTKGGTRSFRCTPRSRSIAAPSGSTISRRSSGTRSPTRCTKSRTARRFSASPMSRIP